MYDFRCRAVIEGELDIIDPIVEQSADISPSEKDTPIKTGWRYTTGSLDGL